MDAKLNIAVYSPSISTNPKPVAIFQTEISTDLPADNLGQAVCDAINKAWIKGIDPVHMQVLITFS